MLRSSLSVYLVLPLLAVPACRSAQLVADDGGAPVASSSPVTSAAPATSTFVIGSITVPPLTGTPPVSSASGGVPEVGTGCSPGKDSIACSKDGLTTLTCASGRWRMLQACKGAGHCKGVGSALTCDTGLPQPGDDCVPAKSQTQCRSASESISCGGGKWIVSPCPQGTQCFPGRGVSSSGCK